MNTFQETISNNQPTLVDFYAPWCGPCKAMHPILEQLEKAMKPKVNILRVDIEKNPDLQAYYSVMSVPTLMLFRQGKPLWRQTGIVSLYRLKSVLREYQS